MKSKIVETLKSLLGKGITHSYQKGFQDLKYFSSFDERSKVEFKN